MFWEVVSFEVTSTSSAQGPGVVLAADTASANVKVIGCFFPGGLPGTFRGILGLLQWGLFGSSGQSVE